MATLLLLASTALAQRSPASPGIIITTPEVDLAYETYGASSPATSVIVANGGPGLSHIYMLQNDVWTRLSHHRQIVFYDQRGTGKSKHVKPDASWGMDEQLADMEAVRAKFGFQKFDLVGDSYGGLLAMAYAAAHPEHIEKLILSDSAAPAWKDIVRVLPDVFPDVLEQIAAREKSNGNSPAAADQRIRDHFLMLFYSEANRDAYLAGVKDLESVPQVSAAVQKPTKTLDLQPQTPNTEMRGKWKAAAIPSLAGKRVIITGANSGIGYHAALKLARKGAQVVLACRDRQRGEDALARLHADSPGTQTELAILDLASLRSVRDFAEKELARHRPLHILINNAGVMAPPKRLQTADGFELQFGTNVLGHFALTAHLMSALEQAAASSDRPRIVTI